MGERSHVKSTVWFEAPSAHTSHVSGRLDFVFPKRVPLVMSATTGSLTRDEIVAYSISDEVAPQPRSADAPSTQTKPRRPATTV